MSEVSWEQVEIDMTMQDVRGGTLSMQLSLRAKFKGQGILDGCLKTVAVREGIV